MANPVNNNGVSAKINVGKNLDVNLKIGGSTTIPDNQSTKIFGNITENLGKNPNYKPRTQHAEDAKGRPQNRATVINEKQDGAPPALKKADHDGAPPPRNNRTNKNQNDNQETARDLPKGKGNNQINLGQNRTQHASERGLEHGLGHYKTQNQGQYQTNSKGNFPLNQQDHNENRTVFTTRNAQAPNFGEHFSIDYNLRANGNQPKGLIHTVVNQVLRQNDIYLNTVSVNKLINNQTPTAVPHEINNLVRSIGSRVLSLLNNSQQNGTTIHQISKEISHQLKENIEAAKSSLLKNTDLSATHFKQLNIGARMNVAVELMLRHLSANTFENLRHFKSNEILNGLLLMRGLIVPGERKADVRNLIAFRSIVLPSEISLTTLRDVGQLVKILISDAAAAKTTANLDLAVQKFVRIMIANNELGVLLATVNLAAQTQNRGGLMSRTLALAQIYQLINQLIVAGEKAMKEAMTENVSKNIFQKDRNDLQTIKLSIFAESDELKAQINKFQINGAESSLRQFLEFNPACIYDNSASAFQNPDETSQARKDFVNLYHNDIDQWLQSGNHRFVKDYDFDKPVGVVVERNSDGFFTANKARFVLVRDGSVQGWHFLKCFLVK